MVPEYFKLPWTWTSDQGGLGDCLVNFTGVGVRWEFRASAVQASGSHGVVWSVPADTVGALTLKLSRCRAACRSSASVASTLS